MKLEDRDIHKNGPADDMDKARRIERIISLLDTKDDFLLLGHIHPDEDCIASMIALGLFITKLNKKVTLFLPARNQRAFSYLISICTYNLIHVASKIEDIPSSISVVAVLDTPKPSMVAGREDLESLQIEPETVMEIDHHLAADSRLIGDDYSSLVMTASSTCEIIGLVCIEMQKNSELMKKYQIEELFSRNLVLTIITGIISDSKMGKFITTKEQQWFYDWISNLFETMLQSKTYSGSSNLATKEDVFNAISALSNSQKECYTYLMGRKQSLEKISYIVLNREESDYVHSSYENDILIGVIKSVADDLAEQNGYLGLVAYYDSSEVSSFIQFRLRRSHAFCALDLRDVLLENSIENGGGHPGAVGFRFEKESVSDINVFTGDLLNKISAAVIRSIQNSD